MLRQQLALSLGDHTMPSVDAAIEKKVGEVRIDALDISFGELLSLHENRELVINPEYQRLFRWSVEQRSRLIESVLLELPIPQIFLIESPEGPLELIDGLQRIGSIIHFIDPARMPPPTDPEIEEPVPTPLQLQGCDLVPELNGLAFDDLSPRLRLRLKRAAVRVVVIKRQSSTILRYEMFKRLNTGGSLLSPQEIRNCTVRMVGEPGATFYAFLQSLCAMSTYLQCTESLTQSDRNQRLHEELVLRFFALKDAQDAFAGSVRDWLDTYMEDVVLQRRPFQYDAQRDAFTQLFEELARVMASEAFVRHKGASAIGGLAPAYFEAVSMGAFRALERLRTLESSRARDVIVGVTQSEEFRAVTGPGANSKQKLERRIQLVATAIESTS